MINSSLSANEKKKVSNIEWNPTQLFEKTFSDRFIEKNNPMLSNLSTKKDEEKVSNQQSQSNKNQEIANDVDISKKLKKEKLFSVHPLVTGLIEQKKDQLVRIWNDLGIDEDYQNEFLNANYMLSKRPDEAFSKISKEFMRVYSIKWLETRLNGLIQQREYLLKRIEELCTPKGGKQQIKPHIVTPTLNTSRTSRSSSRKVEHSVISEVKNFSYKRRRSVPGQARRTTILRNRFGNKTTRGNRKNLITKKDDLETIILPKIQYYRSITVYIIDYIQSICKKKGTSKFIWKPNQQGNIANSTTMKFGEEEEEGIDYLLKIGKDFPNLVKRNLHLQEVLENLEFEGSPLCYPKNDELYYDFKHIQLKPTEPKHEKNQIPTSMRSTERRKQKKDENIVLDEEEKAIENSLLKVNPYYKGNNSFLITEVGIEDKEKEEKKKSTKIVSDPKKWTIKTLKQYSNLKPLFVVLKFRDKIKRIKDFDEPFLSVCHEDLCRLNGINPFINTSQKVHKPIIFQQMSFLKEIKRLQNSEKIVKHY